MIKFVRRFEPKVYENNEIMEKIYDTQADEIAELNSEFVNLKDNAYIQSMDERHIKQWEKILKQYSNNSLDIETRRTLVLNQLLFKPPFTEQRINEILYNIWGDGNYFFELNEDNFTAIIDINTVNPIIYLQFHNFVRRVIPANIYLIFAIQYTYMYLNRNFTYNELADLTYGDLSQYNEV